MKTITLLLGFGGSYAGKGPDLHDPMYTLCDWTIVQGAVAGKINVSCSKGLGKVEFVGAADNMKDAFKLVETHSGMKVVAKRGKSDRAERAAEARANR